MRIKVSGEPQLVNELRDHLRSVGCVAAVVVPDEVEAAVPDAPLDEQELREVRAYPRPGGPRAASRSIVTAAKPGT
jgi:hypothetical protein